MEFKILLSRSKLPHQILIGSKLSTRKFKWVEIIDANVYRNYSIRINNSKFFIRNFSFEKSI